MAKKRGISKPKASSKKPVKRVKASKAAKKILRKALEEQHSIQDVLNELHLLAEEKKEGHKINDIEKKEEEIAHKEIQIMGEENKVEALEKEIKREVTQKPLAKLTINDINKGIIGAFIGVVAHFAFIYGRQIAKDMTTTRAAVLFVFSYVLIVVLMYETGYREVKEKRILGIFPKRATAIYVTSIIVIPIIFFLFNQLNLADPVDLFKQIAVSSVFASIGAGTADMIGK